MRCAGNARKELWEAFSGVLHLYRCPENTAEQRPDAGADAPRPEYMSRLPVPMVRDAVNWCLVAAPHAELSRWMSGISGQSMSASEKGIFALFENIWKSVLCKGQNYIWDVLDYLKCSFPQVLCEYPRMRKSFLKCWEGLSNNGEKGAIFEWRN